MKKVVDASQKKHSELSDNELSHKTIKTKSLLPFVRSTLTQFMTLKHMRIPSKAPGSTRKNMPSKQTKTMHSLLFFAELKTRANVYCVELLQRLFLLSAESIFNSNKRKCRSQVI